MRLASMICRAMYGNGVGIGMELIPAHLQTIEDLRAAPTACCGAEAATTARPSCRWATAAATRATRSPA